MIRRKRIDWGKRAMLYRFGMRIREKLKRYTRRLEMGLTISELKGGVVKSISLGEPYRAKVYFNNEKLCAYRLIAMKYGLDMYYKEMIGGWYLKIERRN